MGNRTYSPEFKLQVVLEALQSDGTDAEVARAYDIHPVTLSNWKKKLKENGSKAFGGGDELKEKKDKIAKLERMVGQKEVEIALLKNFLGESHARLKRSVSWISIEKNTD
ncbi:transposase [Salinibacter ruber]|jgi:transposase|uniref:transposase n=2 Tax=Salinibacter ruber TaxID=146919 RepID=UPI0021695BA1|nr:transposase [Salinibacter ruber]MCS3613088.1 transposase-like protein [Salinibacter ruber]MCS4047873.1 transposase-like protein [Salinibacter ruber]